MAVAPGTYDLPGLQEALNEALAKQPLLRNGSLLRIVFDEETKAYYTCLRLSAQFEFDTRSYVLDLFDPLLYSTCVLSGGANARTSLQNAVYADTLGAFMGFSGQSGYGAASPGVFQYVLDTTTNRTTTTSGVGDDSGGVYVDTSVTPPAVTAVGFHADATSTPTSATYPDLDTVSLTADKCFNADLFQSLYIVLNDYVLNRIGDGVVTQQSGSGSGSGSGGGGDDDVGGPMSYGRIYNSLTDCQTTTDSATAAAAAAAQGLFFGSSSSSSSSPQMPDYTTLTVSSIAAANAVVARSPADPQNLLRGTQVATTDLFATISFPSKLTDSGGYLTNQNRMYFGPVTLRKIELQLLTDRGHVLDLNGQNWTVQFLCDQLYQPQ